MGFETVLASTLEAALAERGHGSAAVVRVEDLTGGERGGEVVRGRVSDQPVGPEVEASTCFDLASLTKLYTATAALRLVGDGTLQLDQPVLDLLGERGGEQHQGMCVRQLLEHTSGLPAWAPLYEDSPGAGLIDAALALPRESEPGAEHRYSDIGFLVLGAVLEAAAGCGLEELIQREVLIPLGLRSTGFRNSGSGQAAQERALVEGHFAATERCPYRGLLCGEVHDDNCWSMGGVGPHAGLFAPASDVAAFAQGIWDAEEQGYLPRSVLDLLWAAGARGHRLGWDTVSDEDSSAGKLLSRRARGHLGFTGTSLWIDPERALAVVLLTNRVHHGRDALGIRRLRPCVHDAVASHRPVL